jgi:ATP-binding cassette, subfamily F, member 3
VCSTEDQLLRIDAISKSYGDRVVLDGVSFTLGEGERLAIVGPNGGGKSTIARIVAGVEQPDRGTVSGEFAHRPELYLPQGRDVAGDCPAWQAIPRAGSLWRLGAALERASELEALAVEEFEALGGWPALARFRALLTRLGAANLQPETPYRALSGGERMKLDLAALLMQEERFLLLDEPSNHFDAATLRWFERFLREFSGALLLISHDRALIDAVAEGVLALDGGQVRQYAGGYSAYRAQVEVERTKQNEAFKRQQAETARIEEDVRRVKQRAAKFDDFSTDSSHRRLGKKVAKLAKVRERRLEKQLASAEHIERPQRVWTLNAAIAESTRGGEIVAEARGVSLALGGRPLLRDLDLLVRWGERVLLSGANGAGKTTLLRLLLGELQPDTGRMRLGANIRVGYLAQGADGLDLGQTPLEIVRAAAAMSESEARGYLHRFLFAGNEVFTPVRALSHGQRARLALARLVLAGVNLLVLDEPLNHLDIPSRERFEEALTGFGGTIIAVSHDRAFAERFATRTLALREGQLFEETSLGC